VTCEECLRLLSREIDGGLEDEIRARISGHLLSCPACSAHREELRSVSVVLDAVCLPLREEAAEIVESLGDTKPGEEIVPVRRSGRFLWGLIGAILALLLVALIAGAF
jgi:anti-sigma factor RsiW